MMMIKYQMILMKNMKKMKSEKLYVLMSELYKVILLNKLRKGKFVS